MHLSEKSRTAMFTTFTELMGEEVAEEMMSHFPASDDDEVVTKSYLRAEMAELRTELGQLRTDLGQLRGEVSGDVSSLRVEMHEAIRDQTKWMTGVVLTSLFGGLAASAAIAQAFG